MSFLDTFSAALPHGIGLEDLKILVPSQWWQDKPEQAAVSALCRCGKFDTQDYLKRYPDVAQKGLDPVLHFVQHGIAEKRHFKCLPDTNWGQSKVRLAYEYFQKGEHEKALQVYEELSEQMGEKNFVANIAICKKKLGSKESLPALAKGISKPKPKVSVLIPVYNNAQYLHECIDSVINQTLKEIEIIIINDGSTDPEAVRILNDYAVKDNRIKLIHKKNTGYGHSMNVGLDNATGEYIGIVESDDYISSEMYHSLYKIAKINKCDVVKSNITPFWGGSEKRKFSGIKLTFDKYYANPFWPKNNLEAFNLNGYIAIQTAIYKKDFLFSNTISFRETPGASYQDIGFYFRTIALARRFYFIDKFFYFLRRDNDQSSVKDRKKLEPICEEYDSLKKFIINRKIDKEFKKLYCKKKFLSYLWNYNRLGINLKNTFLDRFKKDFYSDKLDAFLDLSLFNNDDINQINKLEIYKTASDLISIIIPCYNAENTIYETIDSILKQTHSNFELIIVDDGSTDKTIKILESFSNKDKRIKIILQDHTNAGKARNVGLQSAKGEYIIFLDADDLFSPKMLEDAYCKIKKFSADICVFQAQIYDDTTKRLTKTIFPKSFPSLKNQKNSPISPLDLSNGLFHSYLTAAWNKLFSTRFIKENSLQFQSMRNANDMYFVNISLISAKKIVTVDRPLVFYRKSNHKSLTNTKDKQMQCVFIALHDIYKRMNELGVLNFYERDFINYIIKSILWDYDSIKDKGEFVKIFKREYSNKFLIQEKRIGFFYNTREYKRFKSIFLK